MQSDSTLPMIFQCCDVFGVICSFLYQTQLNYWIRNWHQAPECLSELVRNTQRITGPTLLHLLQTAPKLVDALTMQRFDWKTLDRDEARKQAPMWWLHDWSSQFRNIPSYCDAGFSTDRLKDLYRMLHLESCKKRRQIQFLEEALLSNDYEFIAWMLSYCRIKRGSQIETVFEDLDPPIIDLLLRSDFSCQWTPQEETPLSLAKVRLLEHKFPFEAMDIERALATNQYDVAVYIWSKPNFNHGLFERIDARIKEPPLFTIDQGTSLGIPSRFPTQFHDDDSVMRSVALAYRFNGPFEPACEPRLSNMEQKTLYIDVLIQHAVANTHDGDSLLRKDTVAWLNRCLADDAIDVYFEYACEHCMLSFVFFLWNEPCNAVKHNGWKRYLRKSMKSTNTTLLRFVYEQIPDFVYDNAHEHMTDALFIENIALWTFYLPLLTAREALHWCRTSITDMSSIFFIEAWRFVDHSHANDLLEIALSIKHRHIALFLLQQPETQTELLYTHLPALVCMDLSSAIERLPLHQAPTLIKQQRWCVSQAILRQSTDTLRALYTFLPLAKEEWHILCMDHLLNSKRKMSSECLELMFELQVITGTDYVVKCNGDPFAPELDVIHCDI